MFQDRKKLAATCCTFVPVMMLPIAFGLLGASITGSGPGMAVALPVLALTLGAAAAGWWLLRSLPQTRPPDDENPEGPHRGEDDPPDPTDGPGGIEFDWDAFENDFWSHVDTVATTVA